MKTKEQLKKVKWYFILLEWIFGNGKGEKLK